MIVWDKVELMDVEELLKGMAEYNPRKISQVEKSNLSDSLDEFGLVEPLIYNTRTKRLVGGHQRLGLLKEKNVTKIPVVHVDLDEIQEKRLNIVLNNPEFGGKFEERKLANLINEIVAASGEVGIVGNSLIDGLLSQGYKVDIEDFVGGGGGQSVLDLLASKPLPPIGDSQEGDFIDNDRLLEEEEALSRHSSNEETSELRESKRSKIADDQSRRNNEKFLKAKVSDTQLEDILLAVQQFDENTISEAFSGGDKLGDFIWTCVMYWIAHKEFEM